MKRKLDHHDEQAEALAVDVLAWLAGDEERLWPFLQLSGLHPGNLRESARDPTFLGAVLDHVTSDERSLLACARALGIGPDAIGNAWRKLQAPEFDPDL